MNETWVLVKFPELAKVPYNVVTEEHWDMWSRQKYKDTWVEVARGTEQEMRALAMLMPDPKSLNFD